jgi:hypothetical protein
MKTFEVKTKRISRLVIIMLLISSCASNKDIYRNPYQPAIKQVATSSSIYDTQLNLSQQPDWIYAVSKDFIVGYGSGKDIVEAKNAALNDIKAFIVKSLGETGDVVEVNFVTNSATGRNNSESQEAYLMKNQFESKFKPVINVSIDRFEDYYYEETGNSAKYFIKYNIDATELARIKNDYNSSLKLCELQAARTHYIVDSLIKFPSNPVLESVTDRYNTISCFLTTANLDKRDSLLLLRGLQNIRVFLNTIEIRVLEDIPGKSIRFGLFNGQMPVISKLEPGINSSGIHIDTLEQNDEEWKLRYEVLENLNSPLFLEIYYDLPSTRLTSRVTVPKPIAKSLFEIIDKIQISDFQKDAWNGILTGLTIRMNINYNDRTDCTLTSMEILLHTGNNPYPSISVNNLKFILTPGVNGFAKTVKSDLPLRFFLTREMECDLILYYKSENKLEKFQMNNIPVTIIK